MLHTGRTLLPVSADLKTSQPFPSNSSLPSEMVTWCLSSGIWLAPLT